MKDHTQSQKCFEKGMADFTSHNYQSVSYIIHLGFKIFRNELCTQSGRKD